MYFGDASEDLDTGEYPPGHLFMFVNLCPVSKTIELWQTGKGVAIASIDPYEAAVVMPTMPNGTSSPDYYLLLKQSLI